MPKSSTFPDLYDDALQMNVTKLKNWGYLKPGRIVSTSLEWSKRGDKIGSIMITVNTKSDTPYIILNYKYRDEPRYYKVDLVTKASNLGKGRIWFFVCPNTGKLCRKLYSIGGYFLHRTAFKNNMYECQTFSKRMRDMDKLYGAYFLSEQLYDKLYTKHLKKTYAGKPTKKYAKLIAQLAKSERVSVNEIERLMLS